MAAFYGYPLIYFSFFSLCAKNILNELFTKRFRGAALNGTETQIFIKPGLITGDKIKPKLTNWPDAI